MKEYEIIKEYTDWKWMCMEENLSEDFIEKYQNELTWD